MEQTELEDAEVIIKKLGEIEAGAFTLDRTFYTGVGIAKRALRLLVSDKALRLDDASLALLLHLKRPDNG